MGRTAQCLKTARGGLFTISFFSFLSFFNFLSHYRQKICKRETNGLLREPFPAPGQQYIGVFFRPPIYHKLKKSVGRQSVRVIHDGGSMAEVQLFGLLLIVMRCHQGSRRLMFSAIELGQLFFRFICFPRRTAADRKIPVICEYG